jgi:hypothetical protein
LQRGGEIGAAINKALTRRKGQSQASISAISCVAVMVILRVRNQA